MALRALGCLVCTAVVSQACRHSIEYSLKLRIDRFAERSSGVEGFLTELETAQWPSWFKAERHMRGLTQRLHWLDVHQRTFEAHDVQVRFRRRLTGRNAGKTDLVVKLSDPSMHTTERLPAKPAHRWHHEWHCKTEANVPSNNFSVHWQHNGKVMSGKHKRRVFLEHFPSYTDIPNVSRLASIFPGAVRFVGLNPHTNGSLPLEPVRIAYRWLAYIHFDLRGTRVRAIFTLSYGSQRDLELGEGLQDAQLEWKLSESHADWDRRDEALELLQRLASNSAYAQQDSAAVMRLAEGHEAGVVVAWALGAGAAFLMGALVVLRRQHGPDQDVYIDVGDC